MIDVIRGCFCRHLSRERACPGVQAGGEAVIGDIAGRIAVPQPAGIHADKAARVADERVALRSAAPYLAERGCVDDRHVIAAHTDKAACIGARITGPLCFRRDGNIRPAVADDGARHRAAEQTARKEHGIIIRLDIDHSL